MTLLCDIGEKKIVRTIYDDHDARVPDFVVSEVVPMSVGLVMKTMRPWDSRIFTPIDPTDWTIRVSLGAYRTPVGGTFTVSYQGIESAVLVPAAETQASDIEVAMNAIPGIVTAGGVVVTGSDGFFVITFNSNGARSIWMADATQAIPSLLLDFTILVAGDATHKAVQTLRIEQNIASLGDLDTDSAAPVAVITVLTAGDATHSQKDRITLPANRWGGEWTVTVAGQTSDLLGWDDSAEFLQAAIELITGVGVGNVSVVQDGDDSYVILFKNALKNLAIAITVNATTLKVVQTKSGTLDLQNAQVEFLLDGPTPKIVTLELELTDSDDQTIKIQQDVLLHPPVIKLDSVIAPFPASNYYTRDQIDALLAGIVGGGGGGGGPHILEEFTATNGQTNYPLLQTPVGSAIVFINGLLQPPTEYTTANPLVFTSGSGILAGDIILIFYFY